MGTWLFMCSYGCSKDDIFKGWHRCVNQVWNWWRMKSWNGNGCFFSLWDDVDEQESLWRGMIRSLVWYMVFWAKYVFAPLCCRNFGASVSINAGVWYGEEKKSSMRVCTFDDTVAICTNVIWLKCSIHRWDGPMTPLCGGGIVHEDLTVEGSSPKGLVCQLSECCVNPTPGEQGFRSRNGPRWGREAAVVVFGVAVSGLYPKKQDSTLSVGAAGGWCGSVNPHGSEAVLSWFFYVWF